MLEVTFQNKIEDIQAFAEYMAKETDEGKRIGREINRSRQFRSITIMLILGLLVWNVLDNFLAGAVIALFGSLLGEALFHLMTNLDPSHFYAKKAYLDQEKYITSKDKKIFELPRKVLVSKDYIEISSSISLRRCNWVCIEKIAITSNFIYAHTGGCPTLQIPKRDFPSEQAFKEFGEKIVKYQQDFEAENKDFSST